MSKVRATKQHKRLSPVFFTRGALPYTESNKSQVIGKINDRMIECIFSGKAPSLGIEMEFSKSRECSGTESEFRRRVNNSGISTKRLYTRTEGVHPYDAYVVKHDASSGVYAEISTPRFKNYQRALFLKEMNIIGEIVKAMGMKVHTNAGVHVNVGLNKITEKQLGVLGAIVNNNVQELVEMLPEWRKKQTYNIRHPAFKRKKPSMLMHIYSDKFNHISFRDIKYSEDLSKSKNSRMEVRAFPSTRNFSALLAYCYISSMLVQESQRIAKSHRMPGQGATIRCSFERHERSGRTSINISKDIAEWMRLTGRDVRKSHFWTISNKEERSMAQRFVSEVTKASKQIGRLIVLERDYMAFAQLDSARQLKITAPEIADMVSEAKGDELPSIQDILKKVALTDADMEAMLYLLRDAQSCAMYNTVRPI